MKKRPEKNVTRKIEDQSARTFIAAIFLVVLTLGIFATQQNKGPEGAVALFNYAVQNHDFKAARALSAPSPYPTSLVLLEEEVSHFFRLGAEYESGTVSHKDGYDFVELVYDFPNGNHILTVWVASKGKSGWKIHPDKTIELWKESFGIF